MPLLNGDNAIELGVACHNFYVIPDIIINLLQSTTVMALSLALAEQGTQQETASS